MATCPEILSNWPWKSLGNFKYLILVPSVLDSIYSFFTKGKNERDLFNFLIFPFLVSRYLHALLWISLSRYLTAKGSKRIVDKGIEFEQVDRESNWDDQILLIGILFYVINKLTPQGSNPPLWRSDGAILAMLLHTGPIEFLYYWFHRALHHHFLYNLFHSHHHSSIVTEPITSVIHPFAEIVVYFLLFFIVIVGMLVTNTFSIIVLFGYITYIDFMNYMGHCNFEFIPKWVFSVFPPLKYFMYTPSFHSLHHTKFRTNYSLFMPFYDYIYGTMDKSTDALHETSLQREEESPDVVHLTHLTSLDSIYHMRLGLSLISSKPYVSRWYLTVMLWPVTFWSMIRTWVNGHAFVFERNTFKKLKLHSWAIPRYKKDFSPNYRGRKYITNLIEEAILEADKKGAKVLSLGLLNQSETLNMNGELYIQRHPKLKIKIVDGSSLVAAVVINSIPKETTQVIFRGKLSKIANAIVLALCEKGIQIIALDEDDHIKLKEKDMLANYNIVVFSKSCNQKIWLVGDGLTEKEQLKASKGTIFIPFSPFPPNKVREDCYYHTTPAMVAPNSLENLHSCENWLGRRVMSAVRVAGIVHALEGWNVHECGSFLFDIERIWEASLHHGFRPLPIPDSHKS